MVSRIKRFFPPLVIGTVLLAIGADLLTTGMHYWAGGLGSLDYGGPSNLFIGSAVFLTVLACQRFGGRMVALSSLLIGILLGYVLSFFMGKLDFSPILNAAWADVPLPFRFRYEFHPDAVLSFAALYVISGLETIGNTSGITVAAFDRVKAEFGNPDIVVNNAGITRDGLFRKMSVEDWRAVIDTNLNSMFNVTRQVIDGMLEKGWGRIINISSVNGQKGQFGQTNYSTAKAGLHGFTMALAQEVASKGITVNTVSPGYIATDMVKAIRQDVLDRIVSTIPVRRLGEPAEIASIVAWLASDDASFATGADFSVNGGLHMC